MNYLINNLINYQYYLKYFQEAVMEDENTLSGSCVIYQKESQST